VEATRRVRYSARASRQLADLYSYLLEIAGEQRADSYVGKIVVYCDGFGLFPQRGTARDDIEPGLRIVGYRRRVSVAFTIEPDAVTIQGIFYGGRDVEAALRDRH
jgi:toxin ParE1/3/4